MKPPAIDLDEIPDASFWLDVEVDSSNCANLPEPYYSRIYELADRGLEVQFSKVVTYGGLHYDGAVSKKLKGAHRHARKVQKAWSELYDWDPEIRLRSDGKPRLVLDRKPNARNQAAVSELLGAGVGLLAAKEVFGKSYRYWSASEKLLSYDFWTDTPDGELRLEVRGRFEGEGANQAIDEIFEKYRGQSGYRYGIGTVYAPAGTAEYYRPDLTIVDPAAEPRRNVFRPDLRALVGHYAAFFEAQAFVQASQRLFLLARSSNNEFRSYLSSGDPTLLRAARGFGRRSTFRPGGITETFRGTAFQGFRWPELMARPFFSPPRYVWWGIWDEVAYALAEGRVDEIAEMKFPEGLYATNLGPIAFLDDGTAYAGVYDLNDLLHYP